jgi:hypothetical protein
MERKAPLEFDTRVVVASWDYTSRFKFYYNTIYIHLIRRVFLLPSQKKEQKYLKGECLKKLKIQDFTLS